MISPTVEAHGRRPSLGGEAWLLATAVAAVLLGPAEARGQAATQGPAADPAPFVMSADTRATRLFRCFERLYTEAFRRLGIPLQITDQNLMRRNMLLSSGAIDGEMARARVYGEAHPELIRVEEPVFEFGFALYTANPEVRLETLEALAATRYAVEYRRGILVCETTLRKLVPPERLSDVLTTAQGVKKLLAGRTDLYCELEPLYVEEVLAEPELQGAAPVRRVLHFSLLPTYPYLHKRHAALAPRLAEVLRQLKAEGLYDVYFRDVALDAAPAKGKRP